MADYPFTGTLSVTGNVGIGAEPLANAQLYVRSPLDQSQVLIENAAGTLVKLAIDASGASIGTDMGTTLPLSFQTNGAPRMSIDSIGSVNMTGALTVQNNLTVAGNISIAGLTVQTISSGTPLTNTLQVNGRVKATAFEGNGATLDGVVKKVGDIMTGPLTVQNNLTVTGNVSISTGKLQVSGGAITPAAGNSESTGLLFPKDPGGGGGDAAWMRYFPRTGEACTLEIGISNDADDHIALMSSGNVGIGTTEPQGKLDVRGAIHAGNSDIYFTKTDHNHTGFGNTTGFAAIENAASHGALMILGRAGTPQGRAVKLWDYLQVNGDLDVTGNINGRVTGIGFASASVQNGQTIPVPTGFTRQECVFFAAIKYLNIPSGGNNFIVNCTVDQTGKVSASPDGQVVVAGLAIAKKGGW